MTSKPEIARPTPRFRHFCRGMLGLMGAEAEKEISGFELLRQTSDARARSISGVLVAHDRRGGLQPTETREIPKLGDPPAHAIRRVGGFVQTAMCLLSFPTNRA